MSGQHFLIVHDEPADGMDIEHPDSCKQDVCPVTAMQAEYGLDLFFARTAEPHPFLVREVVTPGRNPVEYWFRKITLPPHIGGAEYDYGLTIPVMAGGVA